MSILSEQACERCGFDWRSCTCPPSVPGPTTRDLVGKEPTILIDQREQAPLKFSVATERVLLPCGDYSLRGLTAEVAIERKSLADLVACCGSDRPRFIEQIERMRDYRFRALVLETNMTNIAIGAYRSQISPLSVLGTLVKIAQDIGVPVWFADDASGAAQFVQRMLIREHRRARVVPK